MAKFNRYESRIKRKKRSKSLFGTQYKPRVIISKSNRYLTVQAVDDTDKKTLVYLCTKELLKNNTLISKNQSYKSEKAAEKLATEFAKNLTEKNITKIVFDRNGYLYHGKVKKFCDTMRGLGINF